MELNWSTFALEILNFLVLMWLLKHFFYQPVMNVIAQRQQRIKQELTAAEQRENEAKALEVRYQHRLEEWEKEKQQAHQKLLKDLKHEREQALDTLQKELEDTRQKTAAIDARHQRDLVTQAQQRAYDQASHFASRLLSRLTSPALEASIIDLVLEDLSQLPSAQQDELNKACENSSHAVEIISAFPLAPKQQQQLQTTIGQFLSAGQPLEFTQSSELIAGLHICIGAWRLEASLADELRYFSQHSQFVQDNHINDLQTELKSEID